jgi:hypothetical protein
MTVRGLFHQQGTLSDRLAAQQRRAIQTVKNLRPDTVLATPEADLIGQLYEKFRVEPLQLHVERAESSTGIAATQVDARLFHMDVTRYELAVPFDGDESLLDLRPNRFTTRLPRGDVRNSEVIIIYEGANPAQTETIKAFVDDQLALLGQWSDWSAAECREYNQRLQNELGRAISEQRQKIVSDRQIEASLRFPVRRLGPKEIPQPPTTERRRWDAFISHASEDKQEFVRPLADALQALGSSIWYDDFALTVGDSLRRSIDHGLANSRWGVVVLSPNFFAKHWPQIELDGSS